MDDQRVRETLAAIVTNLDPDGCWLTGGGGIAPERG
jgi:hypothetical protein